MSIPAVLRINTTDLLRATPEGIRLLLQVCQPPGSQKEPEPPRAQRKPSVNQRRREGR